MLQLGGKLYGIGGVGARQRYQYPARGPGRDLPGDNARQNLIRQGFQQIHPSFDVGLLPTYPLADLAQGIRKATVQFLN